jgi:hypothetical protein
VAPAPEWEAPAPEPFVIGQPNTFQHFKQKCSDPFQCTPAVCFSVCAGSTCESSLRCTPPTADGSAEPTFDAYVGFLAQSEGVANFSLQATPVSGPGCSALDPTDGFDASEFSDWLDSDTTVAGDPESVPVIDIGTDDSADEGDDNLGSPTTYVESCTVADSSFSCCSNGSCTTVPGNSNSISESFTEPAGTSLGDDTDGICNLLESSLTGCSAASCHETTDTDSDLSLVITCTVKESGCSDLTVTETCNFVEQ